MEKTEAEITLSEFILLDFDKKNELLKHLNKKYFNISINLIKRPCIVWDGKTNATRVEERYIYCAECYREYNGKLKKYRRFYQEKYFEFTHPLSETLEYFFKYVIGYFDWLIEEVYNEKGIKKECQMEGQQ